MSNHLRPGTGLHVLVRQEESDGSFSVHVEQQDGADPAWVAGFFYGHDALLYADMLATRYGYTVRNTVGAWIEPGGIEVPPPRYGELISALAAFVRGFLLGSFYDTRNPYTRDEVRNALHLIGSAIGHPVDKLGWINAVSTYDTVVAPTGVNVYPPTTKEDPP